MLIACVALCPRFAHAQVGPQSTGNINSPSVSEGKTIGYMSQDNVRALADFVDNTRRLEAKDLVSNATAVKRSKVMLTALLIPCELTNAGHVASGKATTDGRAADIGLYETACANGMGYLLTLIDRSAATGISCFAASATQVETGTLDLKCRLPENANLLAMASNVLRGAGQSCVARGARWLGQSASPKLDYTEVDCSDDQGYVLRTPAPGSTANVEVMSCKDAASHGAMCQLASASAGAASPSPAPAEARPSLQWFKDALTKNGVQCEVKNARTIGRESVKRRYIVEFQCNGHSDGLVVYVPSPDDTVNTFESIDCATAAKRQLACKYVGAL